MKDLPEISELIGKPELDPLEELQLELSYITYSTIRKLYEWLISVEYDSDRIHIVKKLLKDLNEENK